MADLRRFEIFLVKKAHFPTFISYLIAIKSFNKYINRARKVGIWPEVGIHSTSRRKCQDFLPKVLPFSFRLCYTIRATQSNNEIAFEGITLVKSVFSFTRTLERRRDCVATIRDALFRCVSQIGAHFLFALNSYLSMERVIIWERNQIKTFRVS